jgi:hypothetical protein
MLTPKTNIRAAADLAFAQFQMNAGSDVNMFFARPRRSMPRPW